MLHLQKHYFQDQNKITGMKYYYSFVLGTGGTFLGHKKKWLNFEKKNLSGIKVGMGSLKLIGPVKKYKGEKVQMAVVTKCERLRCGNTIKK